jgi:hypothetical protein
MGQNVAVRQAVARVAQRIPAPLREISQLQPSTFGNVRALTLDEATGPNLGGLK